jgi:hypothetical protein
MEYDYLIEKAQNLLGDELYGELAKSVGEPLRKDKELYDRLWKVYEKVEAAVNEKLSPHEINLKSYE